MIELGWKVRDRLTGFEGVVMNYSTWLTGCDQVGIKPMGLDKDGKSKELEWFDVTRIEVLDRTPRSQWVAEEPATLPRALKGGPQESYPQSR